MGAFKIDYGAITERNRKHSPLLRLSGEIRNHIYAYVFGGNILVPTLDSFRSGPIANPFLANGSRWITLRALTYVFRELYAKTKLLPCSLNVLCISQSELGLDKWCELLAQRQPSTVQNAAPTKATKPPTKRPNATPSSGIIKNGNAVKGSKATYTKWLTLQAALAM
ncbi:hypothetical protein BU25DRAFT_459175 [Macroventuria anomochaeta]|uniref:Uncharacterized protein n=1 Tax=Macroventuria anomochaeta TaxID=301207 RepID=A0ACB6RYD2_9PLEO|nr:uncharacterized protein BU25DRAFT_459175 [Macroventuria anomochaeta]KAF2626921.1 hypothetical protein BU25DRAFT_459175 [Macroventuria anomochaeta]